MGRQAAILPSLVACLLPCFLPSFLSSLPPSFFSCLLPLVILAAAVIRVRLMKPTESNPWKLPLSQERAPLGSILSLQSH
ncbi:hypothetical protein LZ31DRAFT_557925 [Colletotrichum somersetense]|nr:hypothetical protein LZ31DRAFT_557925 [Colletotrichum somersetense]